MAATDFDFTEAIARTLYRAGVFHYTDDDMVFCRRVAERVLPLFDKHERKVRDRIAADIEAMPTTYGPGTNTVFAKDLRAAAARIARGDTDG
jgi:hypothetical protein